MDRFCIQIILLLGMLLPCLTLAYVTVYERESDKRQEEMNSSPLFINCSYENSYKAVKIGPVPMDVADAENMFTGSDDIWNVYTLEDLGATETNYDKCELCSFHSIKCFESLNSYGMNCFRKSIYKGKTTHKSCKKHIVNIKHGRANDMSATNSSRQVRQGKGNIPLVTSVAEEYSKVIDIPIGGQNKSVRRLRNIACVLPSSLETAAISCRAFPRIIKCVQRCAFGYTLESGIKQKMECNYSENVWKPVRFKECKPFVDCNLTLKSGGSLACSMMSVTNRPECRIACSHFEDKAAVVPKNYTCTIDGSWDPSLPFCVAHGSGLMLTNPPKVKLHNDAKTA